MANDECLCEDCAAFYEGGKESCKCRECEREKCVRGCEIGEGVATKAERVTRLN